MINISLWVVLCAITPMALVCAQLWIQWRKLHAKLGGSVQELNRHIVRLGQGDFSCTIAVSPKADRSILAGLSQTQIKLSTIDAQRKDAESRTQRLTQLYAALSQCNQAIVRCSNEMELFGKVCELVVSHGGMKMAWIGALNPESQQLKPVAAYGAGIEYLQGLQISVDVNEASSHGPTGTAFRENRPVWCQDFQHDPTTAPWHARGAKFGWGSGAALPLQRARGSTMVMTMYAETPNAFDKDARALLLEMAQDIDYAVTVFEHKELHRQAQERIQYLGRFDALTGLPNRTELEDQASHAIALARRRPVPLTVMFLDLDHFKDINDSLGHSAGDALLIEVASRLRLALRREDTVSRFGGDEFVFLLRGLDTSAASKVAQHLLDVISAPFLIEHCELSVTGSIGISMFPVDGGDVSTLCKNADTAMYRAKKNGRQDYCFFTAEMQERSARSLKIVNALRHALDHNQLSLNYQAQVSLATGCIVGVEALLRWNHPELGNVSPAEFIPAAEESGLIVSIGEWVLRQAARHANIWRAKGLPPIVLAVNLSAVQFRHHDLQNLVTKILAEEGLPPESLELELTEGVAMHDPQSAIEIMNDLHQRGIRMSIDDFGTGYSSLSYLKKFKVCKLKIDQSFVRDIDTDAEDRAIVKAIIQMAGNLGIHTIAEGVETAEQLAFLRENGCIEIQGYLVNKPLPADAFEAFVRRNVGNSDAFFAEKQPATSSRLLPTQPKQIRMLEREIEDYF
jgi:diguanylate cyclase (GGDEF)-like protein